MYNQGRERWNYHLEPAVARPPLGLQRQVEGSGHRDPAGSVPEPVGPVPDGELKMNHHI